MWKIVILFDQYHLSEDVFEVVFATPQQRIVAKILVKAIKEKGGGMNKTEMSYFATKLHDGELLTEIDEAPYYGKKVKLSYNKRQFYDRILTPMKTMGMIDYDLYKKTYHISEAFSKELTKIGIMWQRHVRQPVSDFKIKKS